MPFIKSGAGWTGAPEKEERTETVEKEKGHEGSGAGRGATIEGE